MGTTQGRFTWIHLWMWQEYGSCSFQAAVMTSHPYWRLINTITDWMKRYLLMGVEFAWNWYATLMLLVEALWCLEEIIGQFWIYYLVYIHPTRLFHSQCSWSPASRSNSGPECSTRYQRKGTKATTWGNCQSLACSCNALLPIHGFIKGKFHLLKGCRKVLAPFHKGMNTSQLHSSPESRTALEHWITQGKAALVALHKASSCSAGLKKPTRSVLSSQHPQLILQLLTFSRFILHPSSVGACHKPHLDIRLDVMQWEDVGLACILGARLPVITTVGPCNSVLNLCCCIWEFVTKNFKCNCKLQCAIFCIQDNEFWESAEL